MNKREVVWLIVRLLGIYFIYLAVTSLFTVAGAGSALYSVSVTGSRAVAEPVANVQIQTAPYSSPIKQTPESSSPSRPDPTAEKVKSEAFMTLLWYIFLTAIYGTLGFYLVKRGRFLFDILNNENSPQKHEANPVVTTLKL